MTWAVQSFLIPPIVRSKPASSSDIWLHVIPLSFPLSFRHFTSMGYMGTSLFTPRFPDTFFIHCIINCIVQWKKCQWELRKFPSFHHSAEEILLLHFQGKNVMFYCYPHIFFYLIICIICSWLLRDIKPLLRRGSCEKLLWRWNITCPNRQSIKYGA